MARNPKHDILFDPIDIGPKRMPNRFYKAPHCTGFGSERPGAQAGIRATAAEGGWGAVNTEACSVHPSSDDRPYTNARIWDQGDVRNLGLMVEKVHEKGALAGIELWYGGAHSQNLETRLAARGVSQQVSEWAWGQACYAMDLAEIRELQTYYVRAATRAASAGFDIVNVYGGHGAPITYQFLDPFYNKRRDAYGGSFENRARFWRETLELVREALDDRCAVAVRVAISSPRQSLPIEEIAGFVQMADDLVDLWDFHLAEPTGGWGEDSLSSRFGGQNFQQPWLEQVRPYASKPVVGVGRFVDPDGMVDAIESGLLDIIGAARPSIADPFLPRKIDEGRLDDIRECIGCNICVGRTVQHGFIACTQNATAGEEYRRGWHPERFEAARRADQDILVVGAGPAGMECAMVLGKRGVRRVHLVDAHDDMGGIMRWIPKLPGLGEWARVVDYRKTQIHKLPNVEFLPNVTLSAEAVAEYGADLVVLATGAHWAEDGENAFTHEPITGADARSANCLTPEQLFVEGKEPAGEDVVVFDCDGYFMGIAVAESLALEGRRVTLITPHPQLSPFSYVTLEGWRLNEHVRGLGVTVRTEAFVVGVHDGHVQVAPTWDLARVESIAADAVVLVTQRRPNTELHDALRARTDEMAAPVARIGDCLVPRLIAECVFDGHRFAREFDSEDFPNPRPFIRESRILGMSDDDYERILSGRSVERP